MMTRIKDVRTDNDYNQTVIAAYLGVDQTTYSRYENGVVDIPVRELKKLAEFYKISIDYLLEIEEDQEIKYPPPLEEWRGALPI